MTTTADPARPSDDDPVIAASGTGDVAAAVVSMSARHAEGRDGAYLEWHVRDHLPEQYRLAGLRLGQRWVSTPACRAARTASVAPFDAVDHIVQYLFAEPVDRGLEQFFGLGAALRGAGRMPIALPRVQVGGWKLDRSMAARRVLVGAAVLPWLPATGIHVVLERLDGRPGAETAHWLEAVVDTPGVAGAWSYVGMASSHRRLESTDGLAMTVCYLDGPPIEVAAELEPLVADRWADGRVTGLLAGPFELVVPADPDRCLP